MVHEFKLKSDKGKEMIIDNGEFDLYINKAHHCITKIVGHIISDYGDSCSDTLTIPNCFEYAVADTIDTYTINSIGEKVWYQPLGEYPTLERICIKLIISEGITNISESAFESSRFREVVYPQSCTKIPDKCFLNSQLETIHGIESVTVIGTSAFKNSHLKDISLPTDLTEIGRGAFKNCYNLHVLDLPKAMTKIGASAFAACDVENIVWPSKCHTIPADVFASCRNLKSVTNIHNVKKIGEGAFNNCLSLESINWPKDCDKVPPRCFSCCASLSSIDLPDSINFIGKRAFELTHIVKFHWPSSCRIIPERCFYKSALTELCNINKVNIIEDSALASRTPMNLDMSESSIIYIAPFSFAGHYQCDIKFPYFVTSEMIDAAFWPLM